MVWVCRGFQIVGNSNAGQLQVLPFLFAAELLRALRVVAVVALGRLAGLDLRFDVFAFPSSRHTYSLTHFAAGAGDYRENFKRGAPCGHANQERLVRT